MMPGRGANPIFFNKKKRLYVQNTCYSHPPTLLLSYSPPSQSGRHPYGETKCLPLYVALVMQNVALKMIMYNF